MAFNLDVQNNNSHIGNYTLRIASNIAVRQAQSFTPSVTAEATRFTLYLSKKGSPTGNIWVTLEADNSGAPSNSALDTSANVDVSTLVNFATTPQGTAINFDFTGGATLNASTTYWAVLQGDYAFSADVNNCKPSVSDTGVYTDGVFKLFDGTNWGTDQSYDMRFDYYHDTTTSIKEVSGVPYASLKEVSGVAIASIGKISGIE